METESYDLQLSYLQSFLIVDFNKQEARSEEYNNFEITNILYRISDVFAEFLITLS